MLVTQAQAAEEEAAGRRSGRGAERQAGQRRRWREGREEIGGGLAVQFCRGFSGCRVPEVGVSCVADGGKERRRRSKEDGGREGGRDKHGRQSARTSDNR